MAEKIIKSPPGVMVLKPVPMKLFATWEVDRTPPNCIRRLCSLTLTRLMVVKALGSDIASITIAVKMQGSKRTLRSNEMALPPNGLLDTELQLNFSLQYPHFLKQEGNKLHIMLQRRKRYKNRTILGYKTLAEGVINMSQVLQREIDLELDLMSDMKEPKIHNNVMAKVTVQSMNSQPVDHEESTKTSQTTGRVTDFSDEDEEFSSNEDIEGSDSEPTLEERLTRKAKIPVNVRQRNLKQKFISLLKRFRVNEDLQGLETERRTIGRNISGADMDPADIEELFEELEEMSDSGPEVDTMSISSTPKPSLRPFFSSSRTHLNIPGRPYRGSLPAPAIPYQTTAEKTMERLSDESSKKADSDSHQENWTDSDPQPPAPAPVPAPASAPASSPPTCSDDKRENQDRERKSRLFARDRNSSISMSKISKKGEKAYGGVLNPCQISSESSIEPRKVLVEQLNRVLPSDDCVPEHLTLVNCGDPMGALLAAKLHDRQHKVISIINSADLRHTVLCLVNKIQKFCNSSPKPPAQIKVLLTGSDSFMNCVLRHYVEQLSCKPPDWQTYIRFLIVPIGSNCLCRYLGSLDEMYNTLFVADSWKELLEKGETNELVNRIHNYLLQSNATVHLPIAEAMLTYKEKSSDDESSQIFIPFMNDVRLGSSESSTTTSVDLDEMLPPLISGSPPSSLTIGNEKKVTPPSSPNIGQSRDLCEPLELQLDYWLLPGDTGVGGGEKKKSDYNKSTLKLSFRSLQVARLSPLGEQPTSHFIIYYSTKEKKQKIMRLGKKKEKEKEIEPRSQTVEGVSRLIVSPKAQNIPLKLCIDGTEWTGVKFFQLSAQWQTHIRHFPVSLFSAFEGTPS